jgi:hypothetical protein
MSRASFTLRGAFCAAALTLGGAVASAQLSDDLVQSTRHDGSLWFHSLPPKRSAGSAQLGSLDLGPLSPPNLVGGIHAAWLEWNQTNVYVGLLGGGLASAEVTEDPPLGLTPIVDCQGAATVNGGWILTTDLVTGGLTDIRPCLGAFIWTPAKLHLMALGGGMDVDEVTFGGGPIVAVQGVVPIHSGIFDFDPDPDVVAAAILGTALVFTPANVYSVDFTLSAGVAFTTVEVLTPAGAPIDSTRGISVVGGGWDFSVFPPVAPIGAALLWNPGHFYLATKSPLLSTVEVLLPGGAPIAGCWGAMVSHFQFMSAPPFGLRFSAMIWQPANAWVVTADPVLTVAQATLPPGGPLDPPLVSNVSVLAAPPALLIERQAGSLYELFASITIAGVTSRGLIVGHDQREQQ